MTTPNVYEQPELSGWKTYVSAGRNHGSYAAKLVRDETLKTRHDIGKHIDATAAKFSIPEKMREFFKDGFMKGLADNLSNGRSSAQKVKAAISQRDNAAKMQNALVSKGHSHTAKPWGYANLNDKLSHTDMKRYQERLEKESVTLAAKQAKLSQDIAKAPQHNGMVRDATPGSGITPREQMRGVHNLMAENRAREMKHQQRGMTM